MEDNTIYYFGTDVDVAGHYLWKPSVNGLKRPDFYFMDFIKTEFNPEDIAERINIKRKGDVFYTRIGKWTICYIEGSCSDDRGGCKSVFFTKKKLTFGELVLEIVKIPYYCRIINQMPFVVKWHLIPEILEKVNESLNNK